jgi:hypothetical protein
MLETNECSRWSSIHAVIQIRSDTINQLSFTALIILPRAGIVMLYQLGWQLCFFF